MVTNCLNYKCLYYYKLNKNELIKPEGVVCFSKMYRDSRGLQKRNINSGEIGIKVYFSKELNQQMVDNYCLLDDNELHEYFDWIRKMTGFSVKESNKIKIPTNITDINHKTFVVKFRNRYPYEIRLIAALIRNIYECPYNMMVKLACLMKNHKEFKTLDFTQRFCIAINVFSGYNDGHSTFNYNEVFYFNDESLRKRSFDNRGLFMNVNSFIESKNTTKVDRIYYKGEQYEDSPIFNDLEDSSINDELKVILINNYKFMKEDER